jgi:hypothetical protein
MSFETGKPKTGGRQSGVPNKRNQEIQDLAKELNCNPAKILMLFAMGDFESLNCTEDELDSDKRMTAAKELMPYLYGKRKPIDSDGNDSRDILSDILDAIDANRE